MTMSKAPAAVAVAAVVAVVAVGAAQTVSRTNQNCRRILMPPMVKRAKRQ